MPYQGADGQWFKDDGTPINWQNSADTGVSFGGTIDPATGAFVAGKPNVAWGNEGLSYSGSVDPQTGAFVPLSPHLDPVTGQVVTGPEDTRTTTPDPSGGGTGGPGPQDGGGGGGGNNAGFSWPTYQGPSPYKFQPFSFDRYQQLSAEDAAKTPGYAFARDQGRNAIQTSAAAKGLARGGGTLKDLFAWGDQFAAQNYQQAEANNQRVYGMNRDNAFGNWYGNQTQGLATWQANNQPSQFGATQGQQQATMTFADLYNRYKAGLDSTTQIATAGMNA